MTTELQLDAMAGFSASDGSAARSKYHTIYLDPPWPIRWQHSDVLGVKQLQYQTMPIAEIMQLPIDSVAADNCLLLMWTTNEFLPEALGIVRHWKFQYEKLYTWCKNNGMGAHPRNATEHLIIATRGNPPKLSGRNDSMILNWIQLPVTNRHSEKPKEIRHILEKFAPEPRLELFARVRHPGWDAWGNEVKSDVALVPPNDRAEARLPVSAASATPKI